MNNPTSPYYSLQNIERLLNVERTTLREIAHHSGAYYSPYDAKQVKSDGRIKWRHIDNPKEEIKYIQRRILKKILLEQTLLLPEGMIGGIAGRSIKNNAQPHLNKEMVVTIDIKDCFPNTTDYMVFKVWRNVVGCGSRSARLLTQLTTYKTILPQGAPTSNALCNLCLLPLFNEIKIYADTNNIAFTLYVDDITISGETKFVFPAMSFIIKIIQKYGFGVRREKIGIMPANVPQKVTGLNTNKKVNIAQRKIEEIRNKILMIARRKNGITKKEFKSINSNIQYVKTVSKDKAEKLNNLVEVLLPENFIELQENNEKIIIRRCRHHKNN